jgi:hypothetical protein
MLRSVSFCYSKCSTCENATGNSEIVILNYRWGGDGVDLKTYDTRINYFFKIEHFCTVAYYELRDD